MNNQRLITEVLDYHLKEYRTLLSYLNKFEHWREVSNSPDYQYTGFVPTKAELKRVRMTINKLMMKLES
ncbi:hypothetical protein QI357_01515 [Staphylococcus saprophyticus]|uniref:hypothetical protein n=1 Tax=Staphylococcus saprophyticus TaxID=29385 RepID=UPI000853CBE3|nr:hypothetical protein [Staphylococcus saprophyticus]MDW3788487.1 hypothetical protein [Staphylococcus saprophyticus]MDW3871228.1 hypothetical protein [Staphylococcus saprophyticus]MDW4026266.1 hypothetical protein [Staphylococcus saprophyticus]OEK40154.1 hypothetical protein ASS89_08675 [Staphylococcus saprophyticus]